MKIFLLTYFSEVIKSADSIDRMMWQKEGTDNGRGSQLGAIKNFGFIYKITNPSLNNARA